MQKIILWDHVDASGDCWEWTGALDHAGYGRAGQRAVHRAVWEELVGPIPKGLQIDHRCRNTRCVNPDHLEPVTQAENIRRGLKGGRQAACRNGHRLTPENTYDRSGIRICRECKLAAGRASRSKPSYKAWENAYRAWRRWADQ